MKRRALMKCIWILLVFVLCSCTSPFNKDKYKLKGFSEEFTALLDDVNKEHQAVEKPVPDVEAIVEKYERDLSKYRLELEQEYAPIQEGMLTAVQAKNDTNQLFYNLQMKYGLYEYFGGDEVFEHARQAILDACDKAGKLTRDEFKNLLLENLSFIEDNHICIEDSRLHAISLPLICNGKAFKKTEDGYQTVDDKKKVAYVEGYEDLDYLFRRSISPEGDIVYYPVVMVDWVIRYDQKFDKSKTYSLTVHYEDGTAQELSTSPYSSGYNKTRATAEVYDNQSIPVVFLREFGVDEYAQFFLNSAELLRDEPVIILDLRSNNGGSLDLACKWVEKYIGQEVPTNFYAVRYRDIYKMYTDVFGVTRSIGKGLGLGLDQPDKFVKNDKLIIVLTSKNSISTAEILVDLLYNVSNVLVVGENTGGYLINDAAYLLNILELNNSKIPIWYGGAMHVFPEGDYFKEGRGIKPDLWVSGADAEELAVKLVKKNQVK